MLLLNRAVEVGIADATATSLDVLLHFHNRLQRTVRVVLIDAGVAVVILTVKYVLWQQSVLQIRHLIHEHDRILAARNRLAVC